jgi:hypothetical protein
VAAPEGTRLVTCCPGLQRLSIKEQQFSAELLAPLQGLSALRTLLLATANSGSREDLQAVFGLTQLQDLCLDVQRSPAISGRHGRAGRTAEELLLQSTQLHQLAKLMFLDEYVLTFEVGWEGDA